jgi:short-subunit dehydrogenase
VAARLREEYFVEAIIIVFDFQQLSTMEGLQKLYAEFDKIDKDVCVLVNNAGKANYSYIHN